MNIHTGVFHDYRQHHRGWFRVFRGRGIAEIWLGNKWINVMWK